MKSPPVAASKEPTETANAAVGGAETASVATGDAKPKAKPAGKAKPKPRRKAEAEAAGEAEAGREADSREAAAGGRSPRRRSPPQAEACRGEARSRAKPAATKPAASKPAASKPRSRRVEACGDEARRVEAGRGEARGVEAGRAEARGVEAGRAKPAASKPAGRASRKPRRAGEARRPPRRSRAEAGRARSRRRRRTVRRRRPRGLGGHRRGRRQKPAAVTPKTPAKLLGYDARNLACTARFAGPRALVRSPCRIRVRAMRPIPATRLGDAHGLFRAIEKRGRLRTDEFVTEFSLDELFPPGLENALGRLRHFISFGRAAGLVKEDRGVVELTDIGQRYVRAGDADEPFEISPQQAEWLRRQLREMHMTDSIYHGLAIGLSLLASCPPGQRVSTMDFGRSMAYLGRAGWDNENTLEIQGERHLLLLQDMEMIDGDHRVTPTGEQVRGELTLPVHMSLIDIAGQQNPGGPEAVREAAEREWAQPRRRAGAGAAPEPRRRPSPRTDDDNGYQDVGPGAWAPARRSRSRRSCRARERARPNRPARRRSRPAIR